MAERGVKFFTLDVFTDVPFAGNQLAVVPDATELEEQSLQRIAREFNYSETVFVYPPEDEMHTAHVRIFTPGSELPFAGHPTIGTAILLAHLGRAKRRGDVAKLVLEEGVGAVPVEVRYTGDKPTWAQLTAARLPERGPPPPSNVELALALGLEPGHFADDMTPAAYSCGVPFLFVPLRDLRAVAAARVDGSAWESSLARYWAPELFVFARGGRESDTDFHARMFAPGLGVGEDPATGGAVAAFAGYLTDALRVGNGRHNWRIEQGFEMGRPSFLDLETDVRDGVVYTVRVGGNAVIVTEGELLVTG